MNEIKTLKDLMNEMEITELKQLCNEIESKKQDTTEDELTKKIEDFLLAPEAELAIKIYFNKEEYEEFINSAANKCSAIDSLKDSFYGV